MRDERVARVRIPGDPALPALPPDRAGAPSRCHSCGAALDVGPRDFGLACFYCGADNLVRMPERWVAGLRKTVKSLGSSIEEIGRQDREMRARERRTIGRRLAWLFVFVPVMGAFGLAFDRDSEAHPPSWRSAVAGERRLISFVANRTENWDRHIPPPITANGSLVRLAFDRSERGDGYSMRKYLLPLRHGETVTLVAGAFPTGARALGFVFSTQVSAIFGDDWRQVGPNVILYPNSSVAFTAPRSAWYRVDLLTVDDVAPGRQFEVGLSVAPPQ